MKKLLVMIMILALAVLPAMAEETPDTMLEGLVTELLETGFVMNDIEMGEVQLNTSDVTVWEGIYPDSEMQVGDYVIVHYDGKLTRSLPPQAHADRVGCHKLEGVVSEIYDDGFLLTGDELFGDVQVNMAPGFTHVFLNVPITVYYDGIMAMSLPGQVSGRHLLVPELSGTVSELGEEGFTLTTEDETVYQVHVTPGTLMAEMPVAVPQTDDGVAVTNIAPVVFEDGAYVTVYYNGATTRSLPPQLTALEVLIHQ